VFTEVAYQEAAEEDALSNYVAGFATEHVSVEIVRVDRDGRTAWRTEYVEDETGTFAGILPVSASPSPAPTAPRPAANSPWAMPSAPAAATGISLVAVLGGLLYYFWPTMKGLPLFGLFSRIRDDKVLDHPQRARLMEAIRADPGVHFQELCRRMGLGHGVLEHHVRKLVDAELVVVRRTSGYTCYFPKATDRRMMDAAPMLRSGGSRAVFRAVAAQPGTSSRDLAVHLGLAPSTVSYHLKRLETAGLVLPDPVAGARLTPLGEQAKVQA
jgi:DNA-binding transcriptional ArsR family regulator